MPEGEPKSVLLEAESKRIRARLKELQGQRNPFAESERTDLMRRIHSTKEDEATRLRRMLNEGSRASEEQAVAQAQQVPPIPGLPIDPKKREAKVREEYSLERFHFSDADKQALRRKLGLPEPGQRVPGIFKPDATLKDILFDPAGKGQMQPGSGDLFGQDGVVRDIIASGTRTPLIKGISEVWGQAGAAVVGGISSFQHLLSGDMHEAQDDARQAFRNMWGAVPGVANTDPSDRIYFADFSSRMGLKPTIYFDIPVLGEFSDKDVVDLVGTFATDPFILSRIRMGQLTSKGVALDNAGLLSRGGVTKSGRLGSDSAAQMRAGERAFLSVHIPGKGRVAIRIGGSQKYIDAPIAEVFDMARVVIAHTRTGRALNINPGDQFTGFRVKGRAVARDMTARAIDEAADFWIEAEKYAKEQGIPANEGAYRILMGQRRLPAIEMPREPGVKAATTRSGPRLLAAKENMGRAKAKQARAMEIRRGVEKRRSAAGAAAEKSAAKIDENIGFLRRRADIEVERAMQDARSAGGKLGPVDLTVEGAVPPEIARLRVLSNEAAALRLEGGPARPRLEAIEAEIAQIQESFLPDPKKAGVFRKRALSIREKYAKQIRALEKRAAGIRAAHQKRLTGTKAIGRDQLKQAVQLEMDADFMLREMDLQHPATISAAVHGAAQASARRLFAHYRGLNFSVDESIGAARAASLGVADPVMAPFAHRFQDLFVKGYFNEVDAGIMLAELTDPAMLYVPRVLTPEGMTVIAKSGKSIKFNNLIRDLYANANYAKRRKIVWDGDLLPEVNEWIRDNFPDFKADYFETNPFRIAARRAKAAEQPVTVAMTNRAAFEDFGRPSTPALRDAGWVPARELLEEANLQAHRKAGGGPSKPLIDAETMRVGKEHQASGRPPVSDADLRSQAVNNLLERGEIRNTMFSRPSTFKGMDIENMVVPPEIATELRRLTEVMQSPQTPNIFWRMYEGPTLLFKAANTVFWPAFTFRNSVHNHWMNHVADVNPSMTRVWETGRIMYDVARGDGTYMLRRKTDGATISSHEFVRQLAHRNALGTGQASRAELGGRGDALLSHRKDVWGRMFPREYMFPDIERLGFPETGPAGPGFRLHPSATRPGASRPPVQAGYGFTGKKAKAISVTKAPFRASERIGRVFNEGVEDWSKIRLALDRWRKGASLDEAARVVRKYLFDYSDLSPTERLWGPRRVMPFYVFPRKNFPLMVETLITKPDKIAELAAVQRALSETDEAVNHSVVPGPVQRILHLVRPDRMEEGIYHIYAGPGIGFEDFRAADDWETGKEDLFQRLNPTIKWIGQALTNQDWFFGTPLDETRLAPARIRHLPQSVKDWMEFREVYRNGQITHYEMNPHMRNFIANAPLFSTTGRALSTSARFQEGEKGKPVRATPQPREPFRSLTGIKVYDITPMQQQLIAAKNSAEIYERFLKKEVAAGRARRGVGGFRLRLDMLGPGEDVAQYNTLRRELQRTVVAIALFDAEMKKLSAFSAAERAATGAAGKMRGSR